jgi:hypothetical protein
VNLAELLCWNTLLPRYTPYSLCEPLGRTPRAKCAVPLALTFVVASFVITGAPVSGSDVSSRSSKVPVKACPAPLGEVTKTVNVTRLP